MTDPFYDVFVSHAYEDQNEFAAQLALSLRKKGLKVWYFGFELTQKSAISNSLTEALKKSRYGAVFISPVYLTKKRVIKEVATLLTRETTGHRLLPVLHNVTIQMLRRQITLLPYLPAVSSKRGMNYVTNKIVKTLKGKTLEQKSGSQQKGKTSRTQKKSVTTSIQNNGVIVLGGKTGVVNVQKSIAVSRKSKNKKPD